MSSNYSTRYEDSEALVLAAAAGDPEAFQRLYQRFAPLLYNLSLHTLRSHELAEDACQDAWLQAYRRLPKLRAPGAFTSWLCRIAARTCIRIGRSHREQPAYYDRELHSDSDPAAETVERDRGILAWEVLASLPSRQHLAFFLREVEGRSYKEIAASLDASESAVETLLFRARKALKRGYVSAERASRRERCNRVRQTMAVLLEGEGSSVQKIAFQAHLTACRGCRIELRRMRLARRVRHSIGWLPGLGWIFRQTLGQDAGAELRSVQSTVQVLTGLLSGAQSALAVFTTGGLIVAGAALTPPSVTPPASEELTSLLAAPLEIVPSAGVTHHLTGLVTGLADLAPAGVPVTGPTPPADAVISNASASKGLPEFGVTADAVRPALLPSIQPPKSPQGPRLVLTDPGASLRPSAPLAEIGPLGHQKQIVAPAAPTDAASSIQDVDQASDPGKAPVSAPENNPLPPPVAKGQADSPPPVSSGASVDVDPSGGAASVNPGTIDTPSTATVVTQLSEPVSGPPPQGGESFTPAVPGRPDQAQGSPPGPERLTGVSQPGTINAAANTGNGGAFAPVPPTGFRGDGGPGPRPAAQTPPQGARPGVIDQPPGAPPAISSVRPAGPSGRVPNGAVQQR